MELHIGSIIFILWMRLMKRLVTLLLGMKKVCVIDTMNGYNDLHKAVREITDKPIIILEV